MAACFKTIGCIILLSELYVDLNQDPEAGVHLPANHRLCDRSVGAAGRCKPWAPTQAEARAAMDPTPAMAFTLVEHLHSCPQAYVFFHSRPFFSLAASVSLLQ